MGQLELEAVQVALSHEGQVFGVVRGPGVASIDKTVDESEREEERV